MEDRERAVGDAGVVDPRTRALLRLDAVLLIVFWVGALATWPTMSDRFAAGGAGSVSGLIAWLFMPAIATFTSIVIRWAARFASRHPIAWSIPRKREFLALGAESRAAIVTMLTRFIARVVVLTTLILGLAQASAFASVTGRTGAASALTVTALLLLGLVLIAGVVVLLRVSRGIEARAARVALVAIALSASACAGGSRSGAADTPVDTIESMPVRAYPESAELTDSDHALRAELIAMGEEDQSLRTGLTPESMQDTAFIGRIVRADSALSRRLQEIVSEHGWPDADRVGAEAVSAAFLIVQHSPFGDFREAMLPHVEQDVRAGVLDGHDYAAMVDRIRTNRGERQLYGTQYTLVGDTLVRDPVEDPADLELRRAELGLMPIAEYERLMAEFYGAEVRSE